MGLQQAIIHECKLCLEPDGISEACVFQMQADVEQTAELIREACHGFVQFLLQLKGDSTDGGAFRKALQNEVLNMQDIDWLKPPMLSKA